MRMSDFPADLNMRDVLARIDKQQAETQKYTAEALKLRREYQLAPIAPLISGMTAGAALFAAGAAFVKVFG
jgi:hypothetical protein